MIFTFLVTYVEESLESMFLVLLLGHFLPSSKTFFINHTKFLRITLQKNKKLSKFYNGRENCV